jgi:hypothetical protein
VTSNMNRARYALGCITTEGERKGRDAQKFQAHFCHPYQVAGSGQRHNVCMEELIGIHVLYTHVCTAHTSTY